MGICLWFCFCSLYISVNVVLNNMLNLVVFIFGVLIFVFDYYYYGEIEGEVILNIRLDFNFVFFVVGGCDGVLVGMVVG